MNLISESYSIVKFLFNIYQIQMFKKDVMIKEFQIMECSMIMLIYILILEIQ